MGFRYLEDSLEGENMPSYLEVFGELQEPTKTVLGYTLDIASFLNRVGLQKEYGLFGGYAVLSNLMSTFGEGVAKTWRGSDDIDLAGTLEVLNSIRSGYNLTNDRLSPNLPSKRTLKLEKCEGEEECKIDFYEGDVALKYGSVGTNTHFGIPVSVVRPEFIIRNKTYTPEGETQHNEDIMSMLSVLQKQEIDPKKVVELLNREESESLQRRIVKSESLSVKDRFGVFPDKEYLVVLKKGLKKKRAVI